MDYIRNTECDIVRPAQKNKMLRTMKCFRNMSHLKLEVLGVRKRCDDQTLIERLVHVVVSSEYNTKHSLCPICVNLNVTSTVRILSNTRPSHDFLTAVFRVMCCKLMCYSDVLL